MTGVTNQIKAKTIGTAGQPSPKNQSGKTYKVIRVSLFKAKE